MLKGNSNLPEKPDLTSISIQISSEILPWMVRLDVAVFSFPVFIFFCCVVLFYFIYSNAIKIDFLQANFIDIWIDFKFSSVGRTRWVWSPFEKVQECKRLKWNERNKHKKKVKSLKDSLGRLENRWNPTKYKKILISSFAFLAFGWLLNLFIHSFEESTSEIWRRWDSDHRFVVMLGHWNESERNQILPPTKSKLSYLLRHGECEKNSTCEENAGEEWGG